MRRHPPLPAAGTAGLLFVVLITAASAQSAETAQATAGRTEEIAMTVEPTDPVEILVTYPYDPFTVLPLVVPIKTVTKGVITY